MLIWIWNISFEKMQWVYRLQHDFRFVQCVNETLLMKHCWWNTIFLIVTECIFRFCTPAATEFIEILKQHTGTCSCNSPDNGHPHAKPCWQNDNWKLRLYTFNGRRYFTLPYLQTVQELRDYICSILMFKCIHGLAAAPNYLCNDVTMYLDIHGYDTRSGDNMDLYVPRVFKYIYKKF